MCKANGVGSGRHWLWGLGMTMPLSSRSPFFFTTSAACGLKIGLVKSPTTLCMMVPSGLRSLLTIGPGPDDGASRLNQRPHMPDKSGVVSAANAGQTNIAANVNAETARWKSFLVIDRMAFLPAYSAYLILSRRGGGRDSLLDAPRRRLSGRSESKGIDRFAGTLHACEQAD